MRRTLAMSLASLLLLFGAVPAHASADPVAKGILRFAGEWRGVPYRWGGTSRGGIDCSAYLRQMFRRLFDVELPRTTKGQIHLGRPIPLAKKDLTRGLVPGDLIFFVNAAGIPHHVVVYAGGGRITHSESGRGVVVDGISRVYGRRLVARRVVATGGRQQSRVGGGTGGYTAIQPEGPAIPIEVPCPPQIRARRSDVHALTRSVDPDLGDALADRDLCELRALATALERSRSPAAAQNAERVRALAAWQETLGQAKDQLFR